MYIYIYTSSYYVRMHVWTLCQARDALGSWPEPRQALPSAIRKRGSVITDQFPIQAGAAAILKKHTCAMDEAQVFLSIPARSCSKD